MSTPNTGPRAPGMQEVTGPHEVSASPNPPSGLWRRWFVAATAGEFLGFAAPAVVGALVGTAAAGTAVVALLAAGAVEGAVLGLAQAMVLRRVLRGFAASQWVLATAAAAVVAWAIGLAPMAYPGILQWPLPLLVPLGIVLGAVLLASIGTAQWFVLRRHVPRAGLWIAGTAGAWVVGLLAFTAVSSPLWQPGQPAALVAAIGALGGLVMAATVAAVTGLVLVRLCRPVRAVIDPAASSVSPRRP
jgi:uncharacterized integral membrane protein